MPTPSSTASSTTPIASISPATACDEPDQDQSQRIDPQLASRQNHPPAGRRLKRATSCRNTERHDLGTTGRHRRNQHPKDAVLVAVERDWLAMRLEISARRAEIIECRFRRDKSQMHQSAGRVVDEREQRALLLTVLKPRVF